MKYLNPLLRFLVLFFSFSAMHQVYSQQRDSVVGTYFLRGVMETASVIDLKPDSSFDFFFSQGALDRGGRGKWSIQGDKVVLNSKKRPEKDFALVKSSTIPGGGIHVKIADPNTMILPYTRVTIKSGDKRSEQRTNSHGEVAFPGQVIGAIELLFELCPDRSSVFTTSKKSDNYFEFRFEPWIAEIFFENFTLQVQSKKLVGAHPLLKGGSFLYEQGEK